MTVKTYLIDLLLTKFKTHSEHDYTYVKLFLAHYEKELNEAASITIEQRWVDGIFLGKISSIHFSNKEALFTFITENDFDFITSIVQLANKKQKHATALSNKNIGNILKLKYSLQANFYLEMVNHFTVVAEYKRLDSKLNRNTIEDKKQIKL